MSIPLRVLIVEDSEDDALLLLRALQRGGYAPTYACVDTPAAMQAALDREGWDIVISDYSMPHFSGLGALTLVKERGLDLPFILVSGTIGEESAVAAMRVGAHDYLMKDNLARLAPAVARELHEAEERLARRQAEEQLRQAEARYRTLVEHIPAITYIAALDQVSSTLYVSPQIETILGFSPAEWMTDPERWLKQLHPRDLERVRANQAHSQSDGAPVSSEFRMLSRDGRVVWFRDEAVVVPDEAGQPRYVQGVMLDITERKETEEALEQERALLAQRVAERTADLSLANAQLARAARLKDEFLASMSHELRSPLNAILGLSEALQEQLYGPLKEDHLKAIRGIEESGRHLLALINDILDLAKIEAGKAELDLDSIAVAAVCQASLRLIQQTALQKQINVATTIDDAVTTIQADARRLKQILVNLLANAVKFTPAGGAIGLEVAGDAAEHVVRFTVWDTGIGIAPEDLARLFQPFIQLDSRLAREYTGTGLGLALVYRMVELHGGSVGVASEVGQGSRFTVTLPWHSSVEAYGADGADPADEAGTSGPLALRRALIIEDSPTAADQLSRYLGELDLETMIHPRGDGAIDAALELQPDVIILDIMLPSSSGWDVLAQLKADPRTHAIPVLVSSVVDERGHGLALGAAGYLVKPIAREQLQRALWRLRPARAAQDGPAPAKGESEWAGRAARPTILLAEDNEANSTMLSDYLKGQGYEVLIARNGAEAIARAAEARPDVILMDIQMPGMDGLEATGRIRAQDSLAHTPIIALTALAMPGDRERCLAAGASDYLSKPVSLKRLLEAIETQRNADRPQSDPGL
jgi:PAS domain S-box-containing protein